MLSVPLEVTVASEENGLQVVVHIMQEAVVVVFTSMEPVPELVEPVVVAMLALLVAAMVVLVQLIQEAAVAAAVGIIVQTQPVVQAVLVSLSFATQIHMQKQGQQPAHLRLLLQVDTGYIPGLVQDR
jgi:hypothetical protein